VGPQDSSWCVCVTWRGVQVQVHQPCTLLLRCSFQTAKHLQYIISKGCYYLAPLLATCRCRFHCCASLRCCIRRPAEGVSLDSPPAASTVRSGPSSAGALADYAVSAGCTLAAGLARELQTSCTERAQQHNVRCVAKCDLGSWSCLGWVVEGWEQGCQKAGADGCWARFIWKQIGVLATGIAF